ncbi:hypothetical protein SS1G_11068 [Sclerotinia sclerotiorum 1980 UF-70]|uniref:Amidase domain-containing protein n=1 Tax=Sclerotinia sclerotiorum (strain ATCC 18683 / 1980 / Ss-1) TaxID=665079 RepID=A7F0F0_SCLS1|nr:hypothetical protein SS1G_11068 [Sclerotinia sclerotiorum 1980 UF-70]EDN95192.1 hypothetical protein SS1G_11068 [Sclerotinia sclerotiorum 1980 UF-70]
MCDFKSIVGLFQSCLVPRRRRTTTTLKLDQISITEILQGLKNGHFSSEELVRTYIKRIEQVNLIVHAVSEVNRNAIEIAREKDEERSRGSARGSLHGVPILIKNLFFTTDGLKTTFGCTGFLEAIPSIEATTVIKLREEGAIILGIANGSQWANNRCTPGWSAVGGQCLGIYFKDQHPKGSSSGSAVGTALGLCAAALGSETSGSVILPAQRSAIVGIKPTVGMTSRYGMYLASDSQDTVGVLARSVKDAALILTVIADMQKSLSHFSTNPHSLSILSDIISYTITTPAEEASTRGYAFLESCLQAGKSYSHNSDEYINSKAEREYMGRQISKLLDKFECDMILLPTCVAVEPADVGGNPVVSVPMGYYPAGTEVTIQNGMVDFGPGIPVAVSFIGKRWDDEKLIVAANAYENATLWREKGKMLVECNVELSIAIPI